MQEQQDALTPMNNILSKSQKLESNDNDFESSSESPLSSVSEN